jgi:hypothetical protein
MTTEAPSNSATSLRSRIRTLFYRWPFQLISAVIWGLVSYKGLLLLYVVVYFNRLADEIDLPAGAESTPAGMGPLVAIALVGWLIGDVVGFLVGHIVTRIAQRRPEWASAAMFISLLLPFAWIPPAQWILLKSSRPGIAVATLIASLLLSGGVTFVFRLHGWPGPMSERPPRELLREYWESRRRART